MLTFLNEWGRAKVRKTIKFHYLKHIATEALRTGCPSFVHTYRDEAYHLRVRIVAMRINSTNFSITALRRLRIAYYKRADRVAEVGNGKSEFDFVYTPA